MQQLPYELLQLVSSNLLLRSQCRLAIVNKYHYKYLYNDILRWHANKSQISVPKYNIIGIGIGISIHNSKLIVYVDGCGELFIENLTEYKTTFITGIPDNHQYAAYNDSAIEITTTSNIHSYIDIKKYGIKIFDHKYKYMHSKTFNKIASIRMSPLLTLPSYILVKILSLTKKTFHELLAIHRYLGFVYLNR